MHSITYKTLTVDFLSMPRGHYAYRIMDNETKELIHGEDFIAGREETYRVAIEKLLEYIEDGI